MGFACIVSFGTELIGKDKPTLGKRLPSCNCQPVYQTGCTSPEKLRLRRTDLKLFSAMVGLPSVLKLTIQLKLHGFWKHSCPGRCWGLRCIHQRPFVAKHTCAGV
mmetsp:Transcript_24490/g.70316  ORF Transcript_24490/g.70316 Transcript_24490/m.70316 type:complete len:105 (-) Transcript_24490:1083-1397(-)